MLGHRSVHLLVFLAVLLTLLPSLSWATIFPITNFTNMYFQPLNASSLSLLQNWRVNFAALNSQAALRPFNKIQARDPRIIQSRSKLFTLYQSGNKTEKGVAKLALNNLFGNYVTTFQKNYTSFTDATVETHFYNFVDSMKRVDLINKNAKLTWWASLNTFSDVSWADFSNTYLMPNLIEKTSLDFSPELFRSVGCAANLGVDWRAGCSKVTTIKDQGNCGSCWVFAAVASVESLILIKNRKCSNSWSPNFDNPDISEQQLLDCANSVSAPSIISYPNSCSGGYSDDVFKYMTTYNATSESNYGYVGFKSARVMNNATWYPNPLAWVYRYFKLKGRDAQGPGHHRVSARNLTAIKAALCRQPIVNYMRVKQDFKDYSGGIYDSASCTGKINHAITLIGWKPPQNGQNAYFIGKNSWGVNWGEGGSFRIRAANWNTPNTLNDGLCSMYKFNYYPADIGKGLNKTYFRYSAIG